MMRARVRYFAAARELAGVDAEEVEIDDATPHASALLAAIGERHPALRAHIGRMRIAVNGELAPGDSMLADGDEVVILPPVAGGSAVGLVDVRESDLSIDECIRAVTHGGAGAVCVFTGVVRDHADGRAVARLDYEAYVELAVKEARRILEAIAGERPGVRLAATHRVGTLSIGDVAVVVAASAPHRDDAFLACRDAIDRIKATVPIWKKEWGVDGEGRWVNLE